MKPLLLAAALAIAATGIAAAQEDLKATACKGKGDGFYCIESGNEHHKINCTNEKVAALMPCPGGCVSATKECKQSTGASGPYGAGRPAITLAQAQTRPQEIHLFKDAACRGKPDGLYCGAGDNRQLRFECTDGQVSLEQPCLGGCDARTLHCRQETGVRAIDRSLPK